jgi:hypothetical protein
MKKEPSEFALCVSNAGHDDLKALKVYQVVGDPRAAEAGCLRVIDESGEDYLYPADCFVQAPSTDYVRQRLLPAVRQAQA